MRGQVGDLLQNERILNTIVQCRMGPEILVDQTLCFSCLFDNACGRTGLEEDMRRMWCTDLLSLICAYKQTRRDWREDWREDFRKS